MLEHLSSFLGDMVKGSRVIKIYQQEKFEFAIDRSKILKTIYGKTN